MNVIKTSLHSFDVILDPTEIEILTNIDDIEEPIRTLKFEYIKCMLMLEILNVIGEPSNGDATTE